MTATLTILPPAASIESACYTLSELARQAGDESGMRAFDKAALQFARGTRPVISADTWLIESRTAPGAVYRVRKEGGVLGCDCAAGLHGRACWHGALISALEAAWDQVGAEDDGDAALALDDRAAERERALAAAYAAIDELYAETGATR